ncbi:MAG: peptide chain release factor N(5)-glutamine methyltransferase [Acidobacteriota bacterium]
MTDDLSASTIDQLLKEARPYLATARADTDPREAMTLLGHILTLTDAQMLARGDRPIASADAEAFWHFIRRRVAGEPVAYLTGERGFYGRDFSVDARVLVPRPETEHLVEAALALELPASPRIVDIGTGSGAIAVTLACERPDAEVVATDIDSDALMVARTNAARHGVSDRVRFLRGDLAGPLDLSRADLVVSNPPYIGTSQKISSEVLDFEPHLALFAPGAGRGLIRRLLASATALRPGVSLILEIGFDQGEWLRGQAEEASDHLELVELIRDYGGHQRTALLRRR